MTPGQPSFYTISRWTKAGRKLPCLGLRRRAGGTRRRRLGCGGRTPFYRRVEKAWKFPPLDLRCLTKIDRSFITGPAGALEALLEWNPQTTPKCAALVCHPHPVYGGTMHNKVVHRLAKTATSLGLPTLRFNFRGAGKSAGTFDDGIGEREDARAALDHLTSQFPDLPVVMMGFSFGSWVGLQVGASDGRVATLVGLGLPTNLSDFTFLLDVRKPKLIVQATSDQYGPREQVAELYRKLAGPKQIHWVEGADHFFTGKLDEVGQALQAFLAPLAASPA